ncbi:MAG TPA: rhomboid family intramembrane serine protease [Jatrophihabitans sp.]|jgi:membrane associated rhomboid family serine protease
MQPTQPPAGGQQIPYGFAGCYRHPDRLTGVRCVRCNRPICPECQRPAAVGFQCPDDVKAGAATIRHGRTILGNVVNDLPPLVSYGLIAINVLVYLATGLSPGGTLANNQGSNLFNAWVLSPYDVGHNHEYLRLITSAFVHIGPIHLIFNMFALYMMGPGLERLLGWWRFLAIYLIAGFGGSVAVLIFDSRGSAGASGAIFGLFAAALLLSRVVGFDTRPILITVVLNFVITFSVPFISKWGHIGGFVCGGLATLAVLGWTFSRGTLRDRNVQIAGLAGLLVLLVAVAAWRANQISSQPVPSQQPIAAQYHDAPHGP